MKSNFEEKSIQFRDDDFQLIQTDTRITDTKLDTKPTTFFKDALRRFRKDKSSVAGFFILAVLILLAIVVPIASPHNIEVVSSSEGFLAPKLFKAGTGFWDGTRSKTHIVYDTDNGVPALSDKYSVEAIRQSLISIKVEPEPTYIDNASVYGTGGVIVFATDAKVNGKDAFLQSKSGEFTNKGDYTVSIRFSDEEGVSDSKLGEYAVYLRYGEGPEDRIMIRDFSRDYSDIDFDITAAMNEQKLKTIYAQLVFDLKGTSDAFRYILLKSVTFNGGERAKNLEELGQIGFTDATEMINNGDANSPGYWSCSGRKGIHNSEIYYCDYVIDTYMLVYGNADLRTYSATELSTWIENGWCRYDYKVGPESFEKLDDACPLDHVESQTVLSVTKKLSSVTGTSWNYRKLGYDKMPKFILGTDVSGFDLFKRAFAGLRTSLILGVCTAAFCFCFGLMWGSVSGYFGGNVDLFMERFCDILGGIPWIVVMTLCILHGQQLLYLLLSLVSHRVDEHGRPDQDPVLPLQGTGIRAGLPDPGRFGYAPDHPAYPAQLHGHHHHQQRAHDPLHHLLRGHPGLPEPGPPGPAVLRRHDVLQPAVPGHLPQPGHLPGHRHEPDDDLLQPLRQRPAGCLQPVPERK